MFEAGAARRWSQAVGVKEEDEVRPLTASQPLPGGSLFFLFISDWCLKGFPTWNSSAWKTFPHQHLCLFRDLSIGYVFYDPLFFKRNRDKNFDTSLPTAQILLLSHLKPAQPEHRTHTHQMQKWCVLLLLLCYFILHETFQKTQDVCSWYALASLWSMYIQKTFRWWYNAFF